MRGIKIFYAAVPLFAASTLAYAGAATPLDPAQALAEKFAHEGEAKPVTATPAAAAKAVESAKVSPKPKPATQTAEIEPAPVPKAERPSLDYEIDMLRRARVEAAEYKAANSPAPPQPAIAKPVAENTVAPSPAPVAAPPPAAPVVAPAAPAATVPAAPAATAPAAQPAAVPAPKVEAKVEPPKAPAAPAIAASNAPHATLLVVLDPPKASKPPQPPDPILCFGETCYMSLGFESGAMAIKKADALNLKTTEDAKAGMCMSKNACVYRDVPVAQGAQAEIIDLANRDTKTSGASDIAIDATCVVEDGELGCDKPVTSIDRRIWVVPEALAMKAGANVLDQAIADGLPEEDQAATTDK